MNKVTIYMILATLIACRWQHDNKKLAAISKIPSFKLLSLDSSNCINSENMPPGHPYIFIYFSPECEHCQRETKAILEHRALLMDAHIYWITNEPTDSAKAFYIHYRLDTLKNAFVGKDYNYSFYNLYLPSDIPYMAIYNKSRSLAKIYYGETNIRSLIQALDN
jgi:hypothetical protein